MIREPIRVRCDLRGFSISQEPFLLLQFLEQVFVFGSLDKLIDRVDIALLGNVDPAILLPNPIPSLNIDHRPWRTTGSHLPGSRSAFHFLLSHAHPVLVRVG